MLKHLFCLYSSSYHLLSIASTLRTTCNTALFDTLIPAFVSQQHLGSRSCQLSCDNIMEETSWYKEHVIFHSVSMHQVMNSITLLNWGIDFLNCLLLAALALLPAGPLELFPGNHQQIGALESVSLPPPLSFKTWPGNQLLQLQQLVPLHPIHPADPIRPGGNPTTLPKTSWAVG